MLEVRLLGKFEIQYDGQPVIISSRIAQSLFAYVILHAGTSHRREKLAGMFWPDMTEAKARAYLRHELWRIRKALSTKSKVDYLVTDDVNIAFNSSAEYWLDVTAHTNANGPTSINELISALSVYQGELLPGFYEDRIVLEREHVQAVYEQKMARLLGLLEKEKRWNEILEWAERWISFGQGPEPAYRYLMIAYEALGDHVRVTSTFERCRNALRALDLEPSEETWKLAFKRNPKISIPIPLTSFIGREKELKEVAALFSKSRLITLTGSGGVGKTRLAIQVVAEVLDLFPDGVWFVDLASLSDPALVPQVVVTTLGLIEQAGRSPLMILIDFLQTRRALLIVDNCEHLIESCAQMVETILRACPELYIIATSRELLRIGEELPYRVPSLELPRLDVELSIDAVMKNESVHLFLERADVASPGFALNSQNVLDIVQICLRLDGIPLAIELAAARIAMLTTEGISRRLDDRFHLLTKSVRTALPRHQTLRATIDWSYYLLSRQEQLLFRRLSVFAGGWTLEAAESVCGGHGIQEHEILDLLSRLLDKSLILADRKQGHETRYRMLETIYQYAREKLSEAQESDALADRHLEYCLCLAETAEPHLRKMEQIEWVKRLDSEQDNLRAAATWALEKPSAKIALRFLGSLASFWNMRAYDLEGAQWLDRALSKEWDSNNKVEKMARAKVLYRRAEMANALDELDVLKASAESALRLCEEVDDYWGIAYSRMMIAVHEILLRVPQASISILRQSLSEFQRLGDMWAESRALDWLAHALINSGIRQGYLEAQQRAIVCARASGDRHRIAQSLMSSVGSLIYNQQWNEVEMILQEVELLYGEVNSSQINWVYYYRVQIFFALGKLEMAKSAAQLFIRYSIRVGDRNIRAITLFYLAWIAEVEQDLPKAAEYGRQGMELFRELKNPALVAFGLMILGFFQYQDGNTEVARQNARESLEIVRRGEVGVWVMLYILCHLGGIFAEKRPQIAIQILAQSEACAQAFPTPRDPVFDKPYFERFLATARVKLSSTESDSFWEAGFKMTLEDAVELALQTLDEL